MTAYIDASVLLRVVFGEPRRLSEWGKITRGFSSRLLRVECLRTIDRARLRHGLDASVVAERREAIEDSLRAIDLVPVGQALARAAEPFPTMLGTLDAIHLSTALLVREIDPNVVLTTHDDELGTAGRAVGLPVIGVGA